MSSSMDISTRTLRLLCVALIFLGLLAAGGMLARRVRVERACRAVDVVLDYGEVTALAGKAGMSVRDTLVRLREAGATAVALPEESLSTLVDEERVFIGRGGLSAQWDTSEEIITVNTRTPAMRAFIRGGLHRVYPAANIMEAPVGLRIRGAHTLVSGLGLGLLPEKVKQITDAGLRVVPRLKAGSGLTGEDLHQSLTAVAEQLPPPSGNLPRTTVIFDGDRIPGYQALIPVLAAELKANRLTYGAVEFAKQKGDAQLSMKLKGQLVRVHSISLEELANMRAPQAVQRFTLAVKDRNIRVLYVHLPLLAGNNQVTEAGAYVEAIAQNLRRHGFDVIPSEPARPFTPIAPPAWLLSLLFAAAGAGAVLWVLTLLPESLPRKLINAGYGVVALGILGSAGLALVKPDEGRALFGLLAAIGYPMLALVWVYRYLHQLGRGPVERPRSSAMSALLIAVAISLVGGLLIAAMLSDSLYNVQVLRFKGPKVALVFPLLLLGAMIVTDGVARAGESLAEYLARCRAAVSRFLAQPIFVGGVLLTLTLLVIVALLAMRSGNEGAAAVSGGELQARAWLDQLLIARPRTKEFAFGFPLFLLAVGAAARRQRALASVLLLGGAVGLLDVVNTFCHAHTSLLISLLRTMHGLWLGIAVGVAALMLLRWHRPVETPEETVPAVVEEER